MRVIPCEQGTDAWIRARLGMITASGIHAATAERKRGGGELSARAAYRALIAGERMFNRPANGNMVNFWPHGRVSEPEARMAYGMAHGVLVREIGFALHPVLDFSGASPDGLIEPDGGLEIKCLGDKAHEALLEKARKMGVVDQGDYLECSNPRVIPIEYADQMIWNLICCERQWWDAWFWHEKLPYLKVRIFRDETLIANLERKVIQFDQEINDLMAELLRPMSLNEKLKKSLEF